MATKVPFLTKAFSAYQHRERPAPGLELTQAGPGTLCGEYVRRYWHPIITSEAVQDLPQRLHILGEDLVVFRDQGGAMGLLERTAPNRPTATCWAVPIDDTHTMQIGFNRAPEGREVRRGAGFGQDGKRPYEERQRVPGDYDAQVSIHGGTAVHDLEHLASTDRGITVLRNMIRRGIHAVQNGADPVAPNSRGGKAIPTYSQDRVVRGIPQAPAPAEDSALLREIGRKVVAEGVVDRP
jgi:hypothetical protein